MDEMSEHNGSHGRWKTGERAGEEERERTREGRRRRRKRKAYSSVLVCLCEPEIALIDLDEV